MKTLLVILCLVSSPHAAETLILVDDHDILYRPGTQRVLHQPVRHKKNPLLDGPTLKHLLAYCSVHHDPQSGRWQMWYQTSGAGSVLGYAESKDGIAWTRPNVGVMNLESFPDGNIVFSDEGFYGAAVVVDPPGGDASRRYKLAYWSISFLKDPPPDIKDKRAPGGGMFVAFSADGIHWEKQPGPVLPGTYGRITDPPLVGEKDLYGVPNSVSDVIDVTYDALRKRYLAVTKAWIDGPDGRTFWKRAIVSSESTDFVKWSTPRLILAPDEHDGVRPAAYPGTRQGVQLHGAPAFERHGVYFALLQLADFETHGLQPIELALSRDGATWQRPFRDTMFLPVGGPNSFDSARIWSNATPIVVGDEMRFYFGGAENPWHFGRKENVWGSKKSKLPLTGIGLATLALDRFAGLKPMERIGQLTLKPRSLAGVKSITVNSAAVKAAVRLELLDAQGRRIPGFTKADAVSITGDSLRHEVKWKSADLSKLPAGEVMIRIHLDRAEVFAITLD